MNCCKNCEWWIREIEVCVNADSEYRADFRCPDDSCSKFEKSGGNNHSVIGGE